MNPHPICPLLMQTLTQENNTDYILETQKLWPHTTDCNLAKWRKSKNTNPEVGVSKSPSPLKWCFHTLQYPFFLLSFSQALASHLDQRIHIVFSLWNVSLQPPDLHDFYMWFFEELSYLQSWNDAMACARHTVSLQGLTWNLIMALTLYTEKLLKSNGSW